MTLANAIKQSSRWLSQVVRDTATDAARSGEVYGVPGQGATTTISLTTIFLMLVAWWYVTRVGMINTMFLPSPEAVLQALVAVWQEKFAGGKLLDHAAASLYRVFVALLFAVLLAIPVGIAMAVSTVARGIFDPIIEFYRPIPAIAYLPLLIIWLGIDDASKIALISAAIFPPLAINTRAGVRSVSVEQIRAAYSLGATRSQVLRLVVLRGAMPEILTGLRIGMGVGWASLVAAEMVAARDGLGHMVMSASEHLAIPMMIAGIVIIGAFAVFFDLLIRLFELVLVPWKGRM
jgi:taurine transport system permease protein